MQKMDVPLSEQFRSSQARKASAPVEALVSEVNMERNIEKKGTPTTNKPKISKHISARSFDRRMNAFEAKFVKSPGEPSFHSQISASLIQPDAWTKDAAFAVEFVPKVARLTKFDENRMMLIWQRYISYCVPQELAEAMTMNYESFIAFLKGLGISERIGYYLYNAWDRDGNGSIEFKELALGIDVLLNKDYQEKLQFIFKLFDTNGDDTLSREEVERMLNCVLQLQERLAPRESKEEIDYIFTRHDKNHDDRLSLKEFQDGVARSKLLSEFYLTSIGG